MFVCAKCKESWCSWSGFSSSNDSFQEKCLYVAFCEQLSIDAFMSLSRALRKLRTFFPNRKISCRILQTHFVSFLLLHSFITSYSSSSLYRAPPCGWPRCRYYILLVIIEMIINNNLNWFLSNASLFIKPCLDSLTSHLIDLSYVYSQSVMSQKLTKLHNSTAINSHFMKIKFHAIGTC